MKKLIISLACLSAFGVAGAATAAPPGKAAILHCGCVVDSTTGAVSMAYIAISVSNKSKGHRNHVIGSQDTCFDGVSQFFDFERTGADCAKEGSSLSGLETCTVEAEGNVCGRPVDTQ